MLLGPSLGLSAILFAIGVAGVILRRNAIVLFMCIELMLNAVNLSFIALARYHGISGQIMVFFVMTVAAAEAAVGLGLLGRLMPQLPVFFFGLPVQITVQLWVLMLVLSGIMLVFTRRFADGMGGFLP